MRRLALALATVIVLPAGLAIADYVPEPAHGEAPHGEVAPHASGHEETGLDPVHTEHDTHGGHHGPEPINFADFSYKDEHKNPPLLLALINFGLLLALLGWKAAPALRDYWSKKSDAIRDGLEEGARLRKEAQAKLEEYSQRIKDVDAEVAALVEDIRAEAKAEKERILADAAAQALATRKAAEERIAADIARARRDIEREVVTAAVAAAEKVIRDKVGPSDHQQLVQSFITQLQSSPSADKTGSPS